MKNTIAIKLNAYKGFSLMEAVKGIHKAGFRNLEIPSKPNNGFGYDINSDDSVLSETKRIFQQHDLNPVAIGSSVYIVDNDVSGFEKVIRLADFFGCKYIVASVEKPDADTELISAEKLAESFNLLLGLLNEHDKYLVMELHGKYSSGSIMKQICEVVNSKRVRINYDTANAIFYSLFNNDELIEDISSSIDYISYFHLKEKLGEKNEWNFPALGTGYVPFSKIFNIISSADSDYCLTAEIEFTAQGPANVEEVNEAVMKSAQYLRNEKIM